MLIAFEGVYSAGKSTQVRMLAELLARKHAPPVITASNSSDIGQVVSRLKIENRMTPLGMVLAEAADLAYRVENGIGAALDAGRVVVADRYVWSHVVRGAVRGIDPAFIRACIAFAPPATHVFFVRCPGATTLERRLAEGLRVADHLSGSDYRPVTDHHASFVEEQDRLNALYSSILPAGTVQLDGTASPDEIHARVAEEVLPALREAGGRT